MYKIFLSSFIPYGCRFYPSCSDYFLLAVKKKGLFKGVLLSLKRIIRCHPFSSGGYDPVR